MSKFSNNKSMKKSSSRVVTTKGGTAQFRPAIKTEAKIHLDGSKPAKVVGIDGLKDSFGLATLIPGQAPRIMVFHHPIGITDLEGDEWVMSLPDDVAYMRTRTECPQLAYVKKNLERMTLDKAAGLGLLDLGDDGVYRIKGKEITLAEVRTAAKMGVLHDRQLTNGVQASLVAFVARISSIRAGILETAIQASASFRTMGGSGADRPQVALEGYRGLSPYNAITRAWQLIAGNTDNPPDEEEEPVVDEEVEEPPIIINKSSKESKTGDFLSDVFEGIPLGEDFLKEVQVAKDRMLALATHAVEHGAGNLASTVLPGQGPDPGRIEVIPRPTGAQKGRGGGATKSRVVQTSTEKPERGKLGGTHIPSAKAEAGVRSDHPTQEWGDSVDPAEQEQAPAAVSNPAPN